MEKSAALGNWRQMPKIILTKLEFMISTLVLVVYPAAIASALLLFSSCFTSEPDVADG